MTWLSAEEFADLITDTANLPDVSGDVPVGRCGVYFVVSGDVCKIGYTGDLDRRVAALDALLPNGARLVGFIAATGKSEAKRFESEMHARFAAQRTRGEWFAYRDELVAFVGGLA